MKVVVFTLGCRVNQYDSDALKLRLEEKGYTVSNRFELADFYILNTCAVTKEAESKSRQALSRALRQNPNAKIIVCGCASEKDAEQFLERKEVVYVSGTHNKVSVCEIVDKLVEQKENSVRLEIDKKAISSDKDFLQSYDIEKTKAGDITAFEEMQKSKSSRVRHYIKVQDGCNNFCSYCIVPHLRGRSRSRSIDAILSEVEYAQGITKEIVLTGINLSAYGKEVNSSLAKLILKLKDIDLRVRLGSLECGVIDDEFLENTKKLKNFCQHFHLSLQSGDDETLKSMNRKYTSEQYLKKVELIRKYYPDAAITTDIIVGFPTESKEAFERTVQFVKAVRFSNMHIFRFSPREKTAAFNLKPLDKNTVAKRAAKLEELKVFLRDEYNSKFLQKRVEVLFESKKGKYYQGHAGNYISVYCENAKRGELKSVVLQSLFSNGVLC